MGTRAKRGPAGSPIPAGRSTDLSSSKRKPPVAFASVYAPDDSRAWWHLAFRCPACEGWHFGRTRDESKVTGPRRTRCGRTVIVKAARTYRGRAA